MTKIAGSGSISQRHGSADPDPPQNVMDPQHCLGGAGLQLQAPGVEHPGAGLTADHLTLLPGHSKHKKLIYGFMSVLKKIRNNFLFIYLQ